MELRFPNCESRTPGRKLLMRLRDARRARIEGRRWVRGSGSVDKQPLEAALIEFPCRERGNFLRGEKADYLRQFEG